MATQKKPNEITKIYPKDRFAKLKYLTKWLLNPSLDKEYLIQDKNEFNNSLKYKLFSYCLNNPKVCFYLNTYMNSLYNFNLYEPSEWLFTFGKIIQLSNVKTLWITKFQTLKRDQFTKLLDDYYKLIGELELNNSEINNLYLLFEHEIISNDFILQLQNLTSGGKNKQITTQQNISLNTERKQSNVSHEVIDYCNKVIANIPSRNKCKYCPGNKKGNLVLESNIYSGIDILVIGLNPTENDIRNQKFLSDHDEFKSALISIFEKYNVTYGFSNRIFCQPPNDEDATIKKMYEACDGFSTLVHNITEAKIKIVIGSKFAKLLNIKSFNKNIGKLLDNNLFLLPDITELNAKNIEKIKNTLSELDSIILHRKNQWAKIQPKQIEENIQPLLPVSNSLNNKFTLFDIQVIHGSVVYIVIDEYGKKQYITDNIIYPVYIKKGKFNECDYITDKMDFVANLTYFEKSMLSQKLNDNLKRQILKSNPVEDINEDNSQEEFLNDEEMF